MPEPKQVIVVRKDLNMRKGKMAAQVAHAAMAFLTRDMRRALMEGGNSIPLRIEDGGFLNQPACEWVRGAFAKIVVGVESEQVLIDVYEKALAAGIIVSLIQDAGRTEFGGVPTFTCVAVGPDYPERIDPVTGHLPLM